VNISLGPTSHSMTREQRGATLLIAIIFLLIITVLGISSMRGVALESRITANLKLEKTLMSAAEAGLRIGENSISAALPPTAAQPCNSQVCMPWTLTGLAANTTGDVDTPNMFTAANAANIATVSIGYNTNIQWYVVQIGKLGAQSLNNCAIRGCGPMYFEVNSCASTVPCTSDTTTQRVVLRTVVARNYPQ